VPEHHGHVRDYDPRRGLGTITPDDGDDPLTFHCTAIVDGSRDIPVGAPVTFGVVPGHLGQWEATTVRSP
jgi:cold shock CspA family protein